MKDLKYLSAYCVPLCAIIGISLHGFWSFLTPIYAFVCVPILELIFPVSDTNLSDNEKQQKATLHWTDFLLYFNVFIVFGIVYFTLVTLTSQEFAIYERIGMIFSCGVVIGSNGINVAHELGHRTSKVEQFLGKLLLLPALYMHFFIEHNFGHHLNAATPEDPATARYNQPLYHFWFTSITRQYVSSWKIQMNLLKREKRSFLSYKNDMLWYTIIQATYLYAGYYFFGSLGFQILLFSGISGFLLLETINYIEHYGLLRKKRESGRYERVREVHSWNSNHVFGRIMLFELTRHSDHHYRANKKYQLLDYHESSPQLPYGYPTSMVLSLFPPLWFKIMNKRVPEDQKPVPS
ncbi:alkane 1-monooxygenase [uncultured Dokdonia sp.]|mgnify:CR=1 FL=1|uniref:alkane 1-monooxygenase n=1 Tax=uncultured Dokdonia sp. TaxID=575653 RepID=UPI00261AD346|nr:alkane 1-monooxygenase [uncultured Dokdonia sp.]